MFDGIEGIQRCQSILDESKVSFALQVAASSLTRLITVHWNSFTPTQRVEMRNYLLNYLAENGPELESFVTISICVLLSRITKFAWFDETEEHKEIVSQTRKLALVRWKLHNVFSPLKLLNKKSLLFLMFSLSFLVLFF